MLELPWDYAGAGESRGAAGGRPVRKPARDDQDDDVQGAEGTIIDWSWFSHKKTGKIPFLIREDILESDEAIVAVIGRRGTTG